MIHHVSVGVRDVARAAKFYDAVLRTLGYKRVMEFLPHAVAYGTDHPEFWIQTPADQKMPSSGNGAHIGFKAASKAQVGKFHAAALAEGGSNNGEPGPRPDYGPTYYGAFIYDLDGNKIEATLYSAPIGKAAKPTRKAAKAKSKSKSKSAPKRKAAKKKKRR